MPVLNGRTPVRFGFFAGFVAVAAAAVIIFWLQLADAPYLRGYDAYYYAVQADFWFRTGRLRIPDSSAVLYAIGALQYFGLSAEAAVRAWTVLSLALFYVTFAPLAVRFRSPFVAVALFAWALVSPSIAFIALELPKTFAILPLLNLVLFLVTRQRTRWVPALIALAAAVACHKMALAYVAAFALALGLRFFGGRLDVRQGRRLAIGAVTVVLAGTMAFGLAGTLGRADLLRLQGGNLMPGLISLLMQPGLPTVIVWEIGIGTVLAVAAFWRGRGWECWLAALLLLTAFIPAFGTEPFSFGERFGLLFPYFALVSCVLLLRDMKLPGKLFAVCLFLVAGLTASFFRLGYSYPEKLNPPYARYAAVTSELAGRDIPMLILHRGMHFYYKYITRRDAFSYEPEAHWDKNRVWRLVYGATPEEVFAHLPENCIWGREAVSLRDSDYTLIRDDCFVGLRAAIGKDANPQLHALLWYNGMNPLQPRPAFLYVKHADDGPEEFPALPPKR